MKKVSAKINRAQSKGAAKAATEGKPKAQWADDLLVYTSQSLISAASGLLREDDNDKVTPEVRKACEAAIVCATVSQTLFGYCDAASLAERIGACNELAACCEMVIEALGEDTEFEYLKSCAEECLKQCQQTAGKEEEEGDGDAHPEPQASPAVVSKAKAPKVKATSSRKSWQYGFKVDVRNEADMESAEMVLSGPIGYSYDDDSGTSGKDFRDAIAKIPADRKIKVRISSEGGAVADGLEIYNLLKERGEKITTVNDGYALSAASLVALAGHVVISPKSSLWMIHTPRILTYGDAAEHEKSVSELNKHQEMMADIYSAELGISVDEANIMMQNESWFTGAEFVSAGYADALTESDLKGEEYEDEDDAVDAALPRRLVSVVAMHRFNPPDHIRQLISVRNDAGGKPNKAGHAASTQEQNNMKETTTVAAAPAASNFEQRFLQERKMRVSSEIKRLAEGKIKNDQLDWWTAQAMDAPTVEAEEAVYAQLKALPAAKPAGTEPLAPDAPNAEASAAGTSARPTFEVVLANGAQPRSKQYLPFMHEMRKVKGTANRLRAYKKDWTGILNYAFEADRKENRVQAANTYSSTLITDFLIDASVTILVGRWAALKAFSIEFGPDRYKEYASGQCKFVTSGGSTLKGTKSSPITNFQQGDATVYPITVPMTHYVKSFNVSQEDLMSGLRVENLMKMNLLQLAKDVTIDALSPMLAAANTQQIPGPLNSSGNVVAYSAGTTHISAGTFGWNAGQTDGHDLATLWGYLKNSPEKNLILDGNLYGRLTNSPGYFQPALDDERGDGDRVKTFGWDAIEENVSWPALGSGSNTVAGLACAPQAIIGVTGLPQTAPSIPGQVLQETVVTLPGPDVSLSMFTWFELSTRKLWTSFEIMGGFAGGDASAGAVIFNGGGSVS